MSHFRIWNIRLEYGKLCFLEKEDVTTAVEAAFEKEVPFAEISIPASGSLLKGVGLGLMLAFLIVLSQVPNPTISS